MPAVARKCNPFAGPNEYDRCRSAPRAATPPKTTFLSPSTTPRRSSSGAGAPVAVGAVTPRSKAAARARPGASRLDGTSPVPGTLSARKSSTPRMTRARSYTAPVPAAETQPAPAPDYGRREELHSLAQRQGPLPSFGRPAPRSLSPRTLSPRTAWGVEDTSADTGAPPGSFGGVPTVRGRQRSALGGSAATAVGRANPLDYVQQHIRNRQTTPDISVTRGEERRDSQLEYADKSQTLIFFDWDDTIFPTTYLLHTLKLTPDVPLSRQVKLGIRQRDDIIKRVAQCELHALKMLQLGQVCGHVIVLTAAGQHGWVHRACSWCYPEVGKALKTRGIQIVYAQDPVRKSKAQATAKTQDHFWGLVKGLALHEEISKFYSRYEGQSWKNVISIGDSSFERYGLLAASTAYMQGRRLSGAELRATYQPMQESAWQKCRGESDNRIVKLRVKCCKFVGSPDVQELSVELDLMCKWLHLIVKFDRGLDLNFEDLEGERQVAIVEAVLRGQRPIEQLPRAAVIGSKT